MIEAIIFDKDGTLFDFQATWADVLVRLLDQIAPTAPMRAVAAEALGFDMKRRRFRPGSIVIAGTTGEVAQALAPVLSWEPQQIVDALDQVGTTAKQVAAVPLDTCLSELATTYSLGLVTNDSEGPARAHLEASGITHHFDFVAGYDSGYGAKPAPGQLLAFAAATGIAPARTLMVGDSTHDLIAGQRAGMVPVAVLTGVAGEAELSGLAEVVLPDIGHLAQWISKAT